MLLGNAYRPANSGVRWLPYIMSLKDHVPEEAPHPRDSMAGCTELLSRFVFPLVNVFWFLGYIYLLLVSFGYFRSSLNATNIFLSSLPLIYLCLSFYSCFSKSPKFRILRFVLNVPLTLFLIYLIVGKLLVAR